MGKVNKDFLKFRCFKDLNSKNNKIYEVTMLKEKDNIYSLECTCSASPNEYIVGDKYLFNNGVLNTSVCRTYCFPVDYTVDDINRVMISKFKLYKTGGLTLKEQVLEWVKKDVLILETKRNSYVLMTGGRLLGLSGGDNLNSYNNDLEYTDEKAHSITKIFKLKYAFGDIYTLGESMKNKEDCFLIWERKKPKYTIEQLKEKLGEEFELIF